MVLDWRNFCFQLREDCNLGATAAFRMDGGYGLPYHVWQGLKFCHLDTFRHFSLKLSFLGMMKKCQSTDQTLSRIVLAGLFYSVRLTEVENTT